MIIHPMQEATADGSSTLRHPIIGDTYHSSFGAVTESMHIFIDNGLRACGHKDLLRILEVGFGSGLNAFLTLREVESKGQKTEYTAIELYPVAMEQIRQLEYYEDPSFAAIHQAPWESKVKVSEFMTIKKMESDLKNTQFDAIFDLVYFDAFAPDTQPELWTEDIFRTIFETMSLGGILATYSSKGDVKRALRGAGFEVRRLAGPPGKRHILNAIKPSRPIE